MVEIEPRSQAVAPIANKEAATMPRHMIKPRWKKGERGNRAREMSVEGLEQLYAFAHDKRVGISLRILAWKTIMERGFGKAVQPVALGLEALIRYSVTTPNPT
jgi:hypothetical protein